jgi:glycosyltransferase involved in cell wall biosynthesis
LIAEEKSLDLLIVNHRDIYHPQAGGAEVVLYEVGRRLAKRANVTWLAESVQGRRSEEFIDGIKVKRRGNKYTLHFHSLIEARNHEIVVDSVAHAAPFFSYKVNRNTVAVVHHVHQDVLKFEVDPLQAMVLRALEKRIKNYDRIIAVSNTTKRDLVKLGINEEKIHVIYNGVDHEKYKPGEKSEKPMILWIGRMKKYKNPFDSLRIYKRLAKKAEMVIAGGGDLAKEFARMSEKMGAKYLGRVTEEEKVKLYQRAWVVLSTSYIEGWGMTVVEANSCGTPVVAYATGSMPEIIREGVNGFLVPYKDYDYAAKVIDAILEEDTIAELSKKSLEESMKYSWEKTADKYMRYLSKF